MNDDHYRASLLRPLLTPGTSEELAGEDAALAAFRSTRTNDLRRRRRLNRYGVGSAGMLLFVAAGGGVAAAYTGQLPDPLQSVVHRALGPIGVEEPHHHRPVTAPAPRPPVLAPHRSTPSLRPSAPSSQPAPSSPARATAPPAVVPHSRPSAAPKVSTSPHPAAGPTSRPTPAPSPAPPLTVTVRVSAHVVEVHGAVTLFGTLTREGIAVPGRTVYAAERFPGQQTWHRVGHGTTDSGGTVRITVQDLARTVVLRLATPSDASSAPHTVTVLPGVQLSSTRSGSERRTLRTSTDGAVPGDAAQLLRRNGSSWTPVASKKLDRRGDVVFSVPAPAAGQQVRYRVQVQATQRHGAAAGSITVTG